MSNEYGEQRLYTFVNRNYMRDIQLGIQSLHVLGDMIAKYNPIMNEEQFARLVNWARYHKTVIVKDGGNCQSLLEKYDILDRVVGSYPHALFHEDIASLNGAPTGFGVVVPGYVWKTADLIRTQGGYVVPNPMTGRLEVEGGVLTIDDLQLIDLMNSCHMA